MTKKEFQQELLAEVTEGVKPSDLKRKLKRSKSADDITNHNPPTPLLQDQLKVKQQEIEELRKQLENKNSQLTETTQQLDNSLFARVAAIKQFGLIYDKLQLVKQELADTVDQASAELVKGDDKNSQLRTKLFTAQQQITSLQRDLNLSQRLVELRSNPQLRKYPLPNQESNWDYLKYPLYSLVLVLFTLWLTNNLRKEK